MFPSDTTMMNNMKISFCWIFITDETRFFFHFDLEWGGVSNGVDCIRQMSCYSTAASMTVPLC